MKSAITLKPGDVENAQDLKGKTDFNYIRSKMSFNSCMTKFFKNSDIDEPIQNMFGHMQDTGGKPSNAWEWFYARSDHIITHHLS